MREGINLHQFYTKTCGCMTFENYKEMKRFRMALNRYGDLDEGTVMFIIQDRYKR